jgi:ubiquitin carboxyl-terminal hydrolase L3
LKCFKILKQKSLECDKKPTQSQQSNRTTFFRKVWAVRPLLSLSSLLLKNHRTTNAMEPSPPPQSATAEPAAEPTTTPSPSPQDQEPAQTHQKWFPLESNPVLINKYIEAMGFGTELYHFCDVYSTEEWALEMIPSPVAAVVLLYPLTAVQLMHEKKEEEEEAAAADSDKNNGHGVWFMKQRIGNACGTVGILHSLLNAGPTVLDGSLRPNSWLAQFRNKTTTINSDAIHKAELLENDPIISTLHDTATKDAANATDRGQIDDHDNLITHFIALVRVNGKLYECDGRKQSPICHGPCTDLLPAAITVIQKFMARDPDEMRFTIMALAPNTTTEDE